MNDLNSVLLEGVVKNDPEKLEDEVKFVISNNFHGHNYSFNVKCFDEVAVKAVGVKVDDTVRIVGRLSGDESGCFVLVEHLEIKL